MRGNEYDRCSWKKSELIYIVLVGLVLEGILVFLFYNSFAVFIGALIPFQIIFIWYCGRARVKERRHRLEVGFRELLTSISSSLSAGYSVENSFVEAKKQLTLVYSTENDLLKELSRICYGIEMNRTIEELLEDLGERCKIDDIKVFAEMLSITKRMGGNLIAVVKQTCDILHDKQEVLEDIQTMITAKKYENRIMSIMPLGMILYLRIGNTQYVDALYGDGMGNLVMTVCFVLFLIAFCWSNALIRFDFLKVKVQPPRLNPKYIGKSSWGVKGSSPGFVKFANRLASLYPQYKRDQVQSAFWCGCIREWIWIGAIALGITCFVFLFYVKQLVLIGIIVGACVIGIPYNKIHSINSSYQRRQEQIAVLYPDFVNRFILFLGSGITMRGAWERMVRDYVRKRSRTNIEVLYLYEEMRHTLIEIQNGESENIAYERFGKRIGLLPYMKFSTMLSQNLRKGNGQLIDQLKLTSLDALQHRREVMKRRGEETSSRLLMPMMVQFLLILIVVLYPAMSTI